MKKLIYVVAIMFATLGFVSCGHSTESKTQEDSTTVVVDSTDSIADTTVVPLDTVAL